MKNNELCLKKQLKILSTESIVVEIKNTMDETITKVDSAEK